MRVPAPRGAPPSPLVVAPPSQPTASSAKIPVTTAPTLVMVGASITRRPGPLHLLGRADAQQVEPRGQGARGELTERQPRGPRRLLGLQHRAALVKTGEGG